MAVKLNASGAAHARSLIISDAYDDTSPWAFSAEDGDKLLGPNGNDWTNYALFHLGEDTSAAEQTKARFKYPYGKDGKVYGAALRSIRSRASQQGDTEVFDEAGRLIDQWKAKQSGGSSSEDSSGDTSARGLKPFPRMVSARTVTNPQGYSVRPSADGSSAAIYIYGPIGMSWFGDGVTANQFRQDLAALGAIKTLDVRINSEGGDVFDAQTIYSLISQHAATVTVHIDGLAASAASFIAMAGDTIEIAQSAFVMIHNASGGGYGSAADMRRTADLLDAVSTTMAQLYADRTKNTLADIQTWMNAETWMNGDEAVARGFANQTVPNKAVAACVSRLGDYKSLPAALLPNRLLASTAITRMQAAVDRR